MIIAGEHSGDILGSKIMHSLKNFSNEEIIFEGVGGPLMKEVGLLKNIIPFNDLSVMGLIEILPKLPKLINHLNNLTNFIISSDPDILITIDSPDFNFRLVKRLKNQNFSKFHIVAPTVWAWRPSRAKKISNFYNHLFTLLPFEPKFFKEHGLPSTYIGNPVLSYMQKGNKNFIREKFNYDDNEKFLLILPGSRSGELKRMLPLYIETSIKIIKNFKKIKIIIMVPDEKINLTNILINKYVSLFKYSPIVLSSKHKNDIFSSAHYALATSGTVSLELAYSNIPSVISYKVSGLTYLILKILVRTRWISLPNIILNESVFPEFIQSRCTVKNLYNSISELIVNDHKVLRQKKLLNKAMELLLVSNEVMEKTLPSIILKK
tara:strand:+ start:262 stop:1395 length:1134 start_codon:yes stop_codon:yes gene_type:complete